MSRIEQSKFSARIDKEPPGPHRLIVTGKIEVTTSGWKVTMKPASPQGINPDILILVIEAIAPTGGEDVITPIRLRYEESPPKREYQQVTIRNDGQEFTVDVTVTQ